MKNLYKFRVDEKSAQKSHENSIWERLGLHFGGFWDALGCLLGALGRLLANF